MSIVPAVTLSEGERAIDSFLTRSQFAEEPLTEKLHHLVVREQATIKNSIAIDAASREPQRTGTSIVYPGPSRVLPGPVQAILLDPAIPDLRDDAQLAVRVRRILDTVCKREARTFWVPLTLVPLTLGLLALAYTAGPTPEIALLLFGCLAMGVLTTNWVRSGKPWLELGYHRLHLNDALALARFRRDQVGPASAVNGPSDDSVTGVDYGPGDEDSPAPTTATPGTPAERVTNSSHGLTTGASPLSPLSGLLTLPGLDGMPHAGALRCRVDPGTAASAQPKANRSSLVPVAFHRLHGPNVTNASPKCTRRSLNWMRNGWSISWICMPGISPNLNYVTWATR